LKHFKNCCLLKKLNFWKFSVKLPSLFFKIFVKPFKSNNHKIFLQLESIRIVSKDSRRAQNNFKAENFCCSSLLNKNRTLIAKLWFFSKCWLSAREKKRKYFLCRAFICGKKISGKMLYSVHYYSFPLHIIIKRMDEGRV
jgi:hypothetical protein